MGSALRKRNRGELRDGKGRGVPIGRMRKKERDKEGGERGIRVRETGFSERGRGVRKKKGGR